MDCGSRSTGVMKYKVWRSKKDKELHVLCREGSSAFNELPAVIRQLGPWTGAQEGEVERLRLPYRTQLAEQGFVIIYAHVTNLHGGPYQRPYPPPREYRVPALQGHWAGRPAWWPAEEKLPQMRWAWLD